MSEDVNKAAESSAAAVAVAEPPKFNPADQYTWSPEQRGHWNETGEVPEAPKKQESATAASPAKEANSEPEGKSAAESETAPKQGKKERKPGEKLSADERIAQLTAEKRKLEQDLQAERERSREAAPKPPEPKTEPAKAAEAPKRPNPFTWTGTSEEYEAAMEKWEAHKKQEAILEFQRNEAARAENQRLKGQLDEVKAKYPDAEDKIKETFTGLANAQLPGVIRAMLNDSECLPELMYVLSDEKTRSNFLDTATKNPGKAIRALAQMETDIRNQQAKTESETHPKTPVEPKPRAPKPPSEVGGRGAAADDELRTAAAAGDFRAFEAEQNRRKFAKAN